MDDQIIGQTVINSVTCLLNQLLDHLSQGNMLYYYIVKLPLPMLFFLMLVMAIIKMTDDGATLFTMGMTRLRGASPALVKHRHQ